MTRLWLMVSVSVFLAMGAVNCTPRCSPGQMRPCTRSFDGGTQSGFQSCDSRAEWSECVGVGSCSSPGVATLPAYSRCATGDQCGPSSCAVCSHYTGVDNPGGYSVCNVFCQGSSDCAPTTASRDVMPVCILGQCTLLCRTTSACPQDSQCLPWNDPSMGSTFPGFDGLCE